MDLTTLRAAFQGRLHTEADEMAPYLVDWRRKWQGQALAVARPDGTADVAAVMRWCQAHRVPVVPQGGNTGLSGGATPDGSGRALVLSLDRMNRVRTIDLPGSTIEVEAGCTLQQVRDAAEAAGRLFPLSLAAQGSCTLGGNLATNAGGVQVLRWGNARELCLGLEVVTPQGEVWNGLRALRKDNSGYALRDLYIGSEGTLGLITAAVLKLFPRPAGQAVALVAVPSPAEAVQLLGLAQARLSAGLTAFELMSDACLALVERHVAAARQPLSERSPWYVLLEASSGMAGPTLRGQVEAVLETALEQGLVTDAIFADSMEQQRKLWLIRESLPEIGRKIGGAVHTDVSVPVSRIPDFLSAAIAAVSAYMPGIRPYPFGHAGDGNIHFNIGRPTGMDGAAYLAHAHAISDLVHEQVLAHGGSISAEHGIGNHKAEELARIKDPVELDLMRKVKAMLDPDRIMNPGKVLLR